MRCVEMYSTRVESIQTPQKSSQLRVCTHIDIIQYSKFVHSFIDNTQFHHYMHVHDKHVQYNYIIICMYIYSIGIE